ncbi:TolC family protein [Sphingobacterium faecium]|uniref:TolC family protein n=1 Tax=Sphingobacterium faecium TaxID=34087 RepID=UPI0032091B5B
MKKIILLLLATISTTLYAQDGTIRLSECIKLALENKANILAVKTDVLVANLQELEAKNKYMPQLSLAYEYRYNPIIASQVIPIGQLSPTPSDEMRAVQFGTKWQQTAGLNLTQPLVDLSIKRKIAESRINEKVKQADQQIAEEQLKYEVMRSFGKLLVYTQQLESAVVDTSRTFKSYELIRDKFDERRVLKTDVNKAMLNHNNAVSSYKTAVSELVKEKIYLSFLTSIPVNRLLGNSIDFSPLLSDNFSAPMEDVHFDKTASVQQLNFKKELLSEQIKTEKYKYRPSLNFIGYLGANQYADKFNPVMSNSWFGNSYVGLSLKMPLTGENTRYKVRQLQTQMQGIDHNRSETENKLMKDYLQAGEDIRKYKEQIDLTQNNVTLMDENVAIFQERFKAGQYNANDLNLQELDLLKEKNALLKLQADLVLKKIDKINFSGNLNEYIQSLD